MPLAEDEHAVGDLAAGGEDEPFRVLLAENQDLYVFGRTGTGEESEPAGDAAERKVEQA
jgi:hypothetical protein